MARFSTEELALRLARGMQQIRTTVRTEVGAVLDRLSQPESAHEQLTTTFLVDPTWATEQASRVAARLNAVRPGRPALEPVVLWVHGRTAFTMPGRWIYLTRELMEHLPGDGAVGFVIAHEMAHHDLGHLSLSPSVSTALGQIPLAPDLALVARHALTVLAHPEWEAAADDEALRLIRACGWTAEDGVLALKAIEKWALDHGAVDAVFGVDPEEVGPLGAWWHERRTGYPSLRDRIERLQRAG